MNIYIIPPWGIICQETKIFILAHYLFLLMNIKHIDTIIIGAGISGLSCAKRFHEAKKEFLVITKDIGGRMKASESFIANYGAAYMTKEYRHILSYIEKGETLKIRDFYFYNGKRFITLFSPQNYKYFFRLVKLFYLTWKVKNHLVAYRKKAPYKSMQECFEEDPFLMKYWLMPEKEFIQKEDLEDINKYIVDPVTTATAFVGSDKVNTVYFLSMLFPAISRTWIMDFTHTVEKLTKGFQTT